MTFLFYYTERTRVHTAHHHTLFFSSSLFVLLSQPNHPSLPSFPSQTPSSHPPTLQPYLRCPSSLFSPQRSHHREPSIEPQRSLQLLLVVILKLLSWCSVQLPCLFLFSCYPFFSTVLTSSPLFLFSFSFLYPPCSPSEFFFLLHLSFTSFLPVSFSTSLLSPPFYQLSLPTVLSNLSFFLTPSLPLSFPQFSLLRMHPFSPQIITDWTYFLVNLKCTVSTMFLRPYSHISLPL